MTKYNTFCLGFLVFCSIFHIDKGTTLLRPTSTTLSHACANLSESSKAPILVL